MNSRIKKDIVDRSDVYPVEQDSRYYNTGDGNNEIDVTTETWRYETNLLEDLNLNLYKSFSSSKNVEELNLFQSQKRYGYGYLLESSSGNIDSAVTVNAAIIVLRQFKILFYLGTKAIKMLSLLGMTIIKHIQMKKKVHMELILNMILK